MHNGRKLFADTFCDVYTLLLPWIDDGFWDFGEFDPPTGSICVVGRQQVFEHTDKLKRLCDQDCTVIFANSAEGSETQIAQLRILGLDDLVQQGRLGLLTGGRLPQQYPHLLHEHFLVRILAYQENLDQMSRIKDVLAPGHRPYDFLFLNGRSRPHRKYLWHRFRELDLLDRSIWSMMEGRGCGNRLLSLPREDRDLMCDLTPIRSLPAQYEVARYRSYVADSAEGSSGYIKFDVFNNEWGEIYLEAAPYLDTYFSVVTETVLECPHSFFTEKIAKPLAMGHPWIAATNPGFYRDIHNLGFMTFGNVIDESFDNIENHQDRMERIITVVKDLCSQDLGAFLSACEDICKYNQQHLSQVVAHENATFPDRFFQFIDQHG